MGSTDADHAYLDSLGNQSVDAKSGQEKMYYLGFSFLTAALPMGLYYSILDLDLGSATNLAAAVLGMGGAMYALCSFYHDMTGTKKHDYHNHVRVNGATKKKEGKEEADERDRVIAKRALMWSLFYNNLIYLICMAIFGFWFFRTQTGLELNIACSNGLSLFVLFFAHQSLD